MLKWFVEAIPVSSCTSEVYWFDLLTETDLRCQNQYLCSPWVLAVQRTVLCRHSCTEFGFLMLLKMFCKSALLEVAVHLWPKVLCNLSCNTRPASWLLRSGWRTDCWAWVRLLCCCCFKCSQNPHVTLSTGGSSRETKERAAGTLVEGHGQCVCAGQHTGRYLTRKIKFTAEVFRRVRIEKCFSVPTAKVRKQLHVRRAGL